MSVDREWIPVSMSLPKDGEIVSTKVDDMKGDRNRQDLKLIGNLWFIPDGSMYVYYRPTHWNPTPFKKYSQEPRK